MTRDTKRSERAGLFLCAIFCAPLVAACDQDPSTDPDAAAVDADADTDADADGGSDAGTSEPELESLVGRYAERTVIVTTSAPMGLSEYENEARYYGLTDIELVDGGLVATSVSCHSVLETTGPVQASMADSVVRSLPPFVGELTATQADGVLAIAREELVMPLGVHLSDPWNEALPTEADDPRVWDQDSDGNPGISVSLTGLMSATVYAVRRERGWWEASVVDATRLSGLVHDSSEQSVIGASNPLFAQNVEETMDPDPSKHTFDLVRLDGSWDCDRVVSELSALFPE